LARDGVPVIEKAAKRVEDLNDCSSNTFGILNSVDSSYLKSLALDTGIEFGSQEEAIDQQLDYFKVQELAQIALNKFQAQAKERESAESECVEVDDLSGRGEEEKVGQAEEREKGG
jgi:hypothetical protein